MDGGKFVERLERKVLKTIEEYGLLRRGEKVVVGASGGKDSTTLLYILKKYGYDVEALHVDLKLGDWSKKCLANLKQFCEENEIKLHVIDVQKELGSPLCEIVEIVRSKRKVRDCSICGVIRRWLINREAKRLGAKKVATGHNLDDEAQTILMNLFLGNLKANTMLGPKVGIREIEGFVQRVKPLYFCTEEETKLYSKLMGFPITYDPCPWVMDTLRRDVKKWLEALEKERPGIKLRLVEEVLKLKNELVRKVVKGELRYCKICEEPSSKEVCKSCQLLLTYFGGSG